MQIQDKLTPIYKEIFNEVVTGKRKTVFEYEPFQHRPGYINAGVIIYNLLREIYDKSMTRGGGRPCPGVNVRLSQQDTKVFLSQLRQLAAAWDGEFFEQVEGFEQVLEAIKAKSQSQRWMDGKPIADKPAEVLPWTKEIEVRVVSGKVFDRNNPTLLGRKIAKDSYENVFETFKVRI